MQAPLHTVTGLLGRHDVRQPLLLRRELSPFASSALLSRLELAPKRHRARLRRRRALPPCRGAPRSALRRHARRLGRGWRLHCRRFRYRRPRYRRLGSRRLRCCRRLDGRRLGWRLRLGRLHCWWLRYGRLGSWRLGDTCQLHGYGRFGRRLGRGHRFRCCSRRLCRCSRTIDHQAGPRHCRGRLLRGKVVAWALGRHADLCVSQGKVGDAARVSESVRVKGLLQLRLWR